MKSSSFLYILRMGAMAFMCILLLTACENDPKEVDQLYSNEISLEEAYNLESYMSEKGITKAKLTAPYMQRRTQDSAYMEFPRTLHVDFFDDSSRLETVLDARYAKYYQYDQKVLLRDSVVVINRKTGDTLRTPELWWDQNKQEFYTDSPSHINQRNQSLHPKLGLRAAQDLSWYDFFKASGQMLAPANSLPE